MKTFSEFRWTLVLGLTLAASISGCRSQEKSVAYSPRVPVPEYVAESAPPLDEPASEEDATSPLPPISQAPESFSPGVEPIVKLVRGGISEGLLLTYVDNSAVEYRVTPEEIIYLRDIGAPESVIEKLIQRSPTLEETVADETATAEETGGAEQGEVEAENVTPPPEIVVQEEPRPSEAAVSPPTTVIEHHYYFHDALAPYGDWVEMPSYGWCWRPTVAVVNVNWRPYYDSGRWLYTDCGWYWQSDYSWGWAPFHYGRWHHSIRYGWVWVPGRVWGPSWVSWRYNSRYCGWAPLPPSAVYHAGVGFTYYGSRVSVGFGFGLTDFSYCFVDRRYFGNPHVWRHGRPRNEIRKIYNDTTVINNYVINSNNKTVINRGIGYREIARDSREEIRKVSIQDVDPSKNRIIRPDTLDRDGKRLFAYRPNPSAADTESIRLSSSLRQEPRKSGGGSGGGLRVASTRDLGSADRTRRMTIVRGATTQGQTEEQGRGQLASDGNSNTRSNAEPSKRIITNRAASDSSASRSSTEITRNGEPTGARGESLRSRSPVQKQSSDINSRSIRATSSANQTPRQSTSDRRSSTPSLIIRGNQSPDSGAANRSRTPSRTTTIQRTPSTTTRQPVTSTPTRSEPRSNLNRQSSSTGQQSESGATRSRIIIRKSSPSSSSQSSSIRNSTPGRNAESERPSSTPSRKTIINRSTPQNTQPTPRIVRPTGPNQNAPTTSRRITAPSRAPQTQTPGPTIIRSPSSSRSIIQNRRSSTPSVRSSPRIISRPSISSRAPTVSSPRSFSAPSRSSTISRSPSGSSFSRSVPSRSSSFRSAPSGSRSIGSRSSGGPSRSSGGRTSPR